MPSTNNSPHPGVPQETFKAFEVAHSMIVVLVTLPPDRVTAGQRQGKLPELRSRESC